MPQAVTHILLPILLVSFWRDYYLRKRDRSQFPLHYVLIAGLGGVLPDVDFAAFWLAKAAGITNYALHRSYTHYLIIPIILFLGFFALKNINHPSLGRHKLRLNIICLMLALGYTIHILLDAYLMGPIQLLLPLITIEIGSPLLQSWLGEAAGLFTATLDGALLVIWITYLEWKHKISNFI
ncbi:hypothetical protein CMI48_03730 [Candidatus Pacearchaeota archaeon]|nr:hypothetical protein [Candidatus Pacearchaeota archaeon]